ncbi:prepilin-type N-terminal cleavage/methylation domain-containing protein [Poriferisphaera sp. WC338]|uniref:prepilin-type N-terminal cleavage/methylation domain-containing protein n=1 Tax=Poriferisphaera sp. WC338 TaxID=3425129 RepID=UPI003D817FEE
MNKHKNNAFTLIELLVVISIIALIISILLPALSAAREAGRGVSCLSNQKQIVMAMVVYSNENNGYFPPYLNSAHPVGPQRPWGNTLLRLGFLPTDIFTCPTYRVQDAYSLEDAVVEPATDQQSLYWSHYGYNFYHIGSSFRIPSHPNPANTPARTEDVRKGAQTIVLVDSEYNPLPPGYFGGTNIGGYYVVQDFPHPVLNPHARHAQHAVNVAWFDGHVSAVKVADPLQPYVELTSVSTEPLNNLWDRK